MTDKASHRGLESGDASSFGYYGVPVIHGSHWKWLVIWYFFFGGISGAAAVIAAMARLSGGNRSDALARTATYVSFVTFLPCPPLLILDLGRPGRFFNMLRAFRPYSPMSLGSWGLTVFGIISTLGTAAQFSSDRGVNRNHRRSARLAQSETLLTPLAAVSGFFLAGYTGTLLAATAVPLWAKRPAILGPLFLASAMTSGTAAVSLVHAVTTNDDVGGGQLHRLEAIAAISEGALLTAWLVSLGSTGSPLRQGHIGKVVRQGVVATGIMAPLALTGLSTLVPRPLRTVLNLIAPVMTLCGVFALRYSVVEGGRISADDPRATFDLTS